MSLEYKFFTPMKLEERYKASVGSIVSIFLEEWPRQIKAFASAYQEPSDAGLLEELAHSMKGSFDMISAQELSSLACQIEESLAKGALNQTILDLCEKLVRNAGVLESELTRYQNQI